MTRIGRVGAGLALLVGGVTGPILGDAVAANRGETSAPITGVELVPPAGGDTLLSVTPRFIIRAIDPRPEDRLILLGLQVAYNPAFNVPLVVDSTLVGDTAVVTLRRPLPEGARVYIRATARTVTGEVVTSPTIVRFVPPWLTLLSPNDPNGVTLETPRPRFVWRSAPIDGPSGPWIYDLEIRNVGSGQSTFYANLTDTTLTPSAPLEYNTSYRWSVTARHRGGESVTVQSRSSFVIINAAVPLATLLYQNFPNPFPTATSTSTCVWFDLHQSGRVHLDVFDLSGRHVKNIVPGPVGAVTYPAGRHGRVSGGPVPSGCNGDIQWDGTGENGRVVSPGVYLLRLRAAGVESVKKIVFRGRP